MNERREERKALVRFHNDALMFKRTTAIEDQLTAQMLPDIRAKGWTEIPVTYPFIDVPIIMQYLDEHGWLDRITFALVPSEAPSGTWSCLITSIALSVSAVATKVEPESEFPGMEPPVPEDGLTVTITGVQAVTAETRFPDNPKRCRQCDHFRDAFEAGEELGCRPLGETNPTANICRAFLQVAMSHLTHHEVM